MRERRWRDFFGGITILTVNINRIKRHIEKLKKFTSTPGEGCTRLSFSQEDRKARLHLLKEFRELGLSIQLDGVGNIRGRLEGKDPKAPIVMTGSHLDTVIHGGIFDGALGVVCGLEVLQVLVEHTISLTHPVEVVIFVEEEGASFGGALVGSSALVGSYSVQHFKELKNHEGLSFFQAAQGFGLRPEEMPSFVLKPHQVKAFVELHIEQSPFLDSTTIPVGIVESIAGFQWLQVNLTGVSNHAGTTPMPNRQDPLLAAAKIITSLPEILEKEAFKTTIGTVGKIHCSPNLVNVIPNKVSFFIDIRDSQKEGIEVTARAIRKRVREVALQHGLTASVKALAQREPLSLSNALLSIMEEKAVEREVKHVRLNSGALHDTCMMSLITDVGMIFVPSIGGRSHVPEENTGYEEIQAGCNLLLDTIMALAR